MHILVTGGAGYIGSHVALALLSRGHRVTVVDDLSNGDARLVPAGATLLVADAAGILPHLPTHGPDGIIHLAGAMRVAESLTQPLHYWRTNTAKTIEIAAFAAARGIPLVFSSTAAVYGDPETVPVREDARLAPISPYGWSKLAAEQVLREAGAAHGLAWTALRYFNVAGADPAGRAGQLGRGNTHLFKVATYSAARGLRGMPIHGTDHATPDGTCVRDYVHVADLAAVHALALERLASGGAPDVFNVGYGRGASVLEVIRAVERVAGCDLGATPAGRRPGDPARLIADPARLQRATGWRPRHDDLEVIAATALAWERAQVARP
jgi:UDP-glucose 4-epimerase